MFGSLICDGVGPICLGPKLVTIKTKNKNKKFLEKGKTERKEKHISLPIFHQIANLASSVVRSSWNLEKMFKTRVATIWIIEIRFWAWKLVLLSMNSNDVFFGILSPIFLVFAKRDYIIQDYMCSWCIE